MITNEFLPVIWFQTLVNPIKAKFELELMLLTMQVIQRSQVSSTTAKEMTWNT